MNRRDFLVGLPVVGAAVTACGCGSKPAPQAAVPADPNLTWSKAPCRYCGTGCGVEVGVGDGKVLAVRGDVASPVNRGLLCVKGYHLPAMLYGQDRLLYPQKRNPHGGGFTRISWDEALDLIAKKYREVLDKHG